MTYVARAAQLFNLHVGAVLQGELAPARTVLALITWFIVFQTRCVRAILSWVVYSIIFVGAHMAFRVPPSEYRTTKRPGVPFREVLGMCLSPQAPGPVVKSPPISPSCNFCATGLDVCIEEFAFISLQGDRISMAFELQRKGRGLANGL